MTAKLRVHTREVGSKVVTEERWTIYPEEIEELAGDWKSYAQLVIRSFNSSRRSWEQPRELVDVIGLEEEEE